SLRNERSGLTFGDDPGRAGSRSLDDPGRVRGVDGEGSKDLFLSVPGFGDSADSQGMPNTTTAKTIGAPELAEQQLASVQAAVERLSGMLVGGLSEAERAQIAGLEQAAG